MGGTEVPDCRDIRRESSRPDRWLTARWPERRYVVLCAHHIPAALMVLLSLEFMPRPRRLRVPRRSDNSAGQCGHA